MSVFVCVVVPVYVGPECLLHKRRRTANEDTVMKNKRVKHDSSEEEPHEDTVVQSEFTEVTTYTPKKMFMHLRLALK